MQNKKARKSARAVNRFLQPELIDIDGEKKLGNKIPKTQRDLSAIVAANDRALRRADKTLPREISPTHYLFFHKLQTIALRENEKEADVKCPHCKQFLKVTMHDSKAEGNSVKALEIGFDRMFPRLASLTHEVNISGQINIITEQLATLIIKYVPNDKVALCSAELVDFIEQVQRNEQQRQVQQSNSGGLSLAV